MIYMGKNIKFGTHILLVSQSVPAQLDSRVGILSQYNGIPLWDDPSHVISKMKAHARTCVRDIVFNHLNCTNISLHMYSLQQNMRIPN